MVKSVEAGRVVQTCPICGRGIIMDHNLSDLNYDKHVEACPKQSMKARRAAGRAYIRQQAKKARALDGAVPKLGQLGFPFDGVPKEIGA